MRRTYVGILCCFLVCIGLTVAFPTGWPGRAYDWNIARNMKAVRLVDQYLLPASWPASYRRAVEFEVGRGCAAVGGLGLLLLKITRRRAKPGDLD